MKANAFFYEGTYYLLPEDCATVAELNQNYRNGKSFVTTKLVEKKCMAPYFVKEHAKQKKLTLKRNISKSPVFPAEVELMSMAEYNDRLRSIVPEFCKNCSGFEAIDETDESLDGHHEEISLDSVCFLKKQFADKTGDYDTQFDRWFTNVVRYFGNLGLEQLIDDGQIEQAQEKLGVLLDRALFVTPCIWLDKQEDGKYRLIYTNFFDFTASLIQRTLFLALEKKYGKTWSFIGGIPKGYFRPEAVRPLGVSVIEGERLELNIYADPNAACEDGVAPQMLAYLWMAGTYGEKELMGSCYFSFLLPDEENPLPEDVIAPDAPELASMLEELWEQRPYDRRDQYPVDMVDRDFAAALSENPTEEEIKGLITVSIEREPNLAFRFAVPLAYDEVPQDIWSSRAALGTAPIGRIRMELPGLDLLYGENTDQVDAMHALRAYSDGLTEKKLICVFDQRYSQNALELWFVILNHAQFLYEARRQAPIHMAYPMSLYVYTRSGKNGGRYMPDYKMRRVESEKALRGKWKEV